MSTLSLLVIAFTPHFCKKRNSFPLIHPDALCTTDHKSPTGVSGPSVSQNLLQLFFFAFLITLLATALNYLHSSAKSTIGYFLNFLYARFVSFTTTLHSLFHQGTNIRVLGFCFLGMVQRAAL